MMAADTTDRLVYVVEDDNALRDSLCWLIESAGYSVSAYSNAESFLAYLEPDARGCLVLDVRMPGMSGLELQERLIRRGQHLPIIFITGHGDVPMAVSAIKRGALDFIEKPFQDQELLARIQSVAKSGRSPLEFRERPRLVESRLEMLSRREREVMDRVIEGKPNKWIAKDLGISVKTVEAHRARMMGKLDVNSVAELVRLSIGWSKPDATL
jgi:FixJ family two-component response regulator